MEIVFNLFRSAKTNGLLYVSSSVCSKYQKSNFLLLIKINAIYQKKIEII